MMEKKRRRLLYAWLVMLAAATAWAEPAVPKVEFKVVFSEDFEGEGKDFVPKWDLAGSQFERDTSVFRNGRASLRLQATGKEDTFAFETRPFTGVVGQNYRITFWAKANHRVTVKLDSRPVGGGRGLIGGNFLAPLEWRKITITDIIRPEEGFSSPGPIYIQWRVVNRNVWSTGRRVVNRNKRVSLWIDDFRVEEASLIDQAGWTPVAEGRNLIPNGSFEVDPSRHYIQWQVSNDRGPDHNWQFSEDAAYGSRSVKLGEPRRYGTCPLYRLGPPLELIYPLALDSADAEFTLSASVKAVGAQRRNVVLVLGGPVNMSMSIPPGSITLEMPSTGQWARHQKTFRLPRVPDGKYWLYVRGKHVLLDGLMLTRGKSSTFVPRESVEATLTSAKPWRVYTPNDPLAFTLRALQADADAPESLEITLVNYRQQPIRTLHGPLNAKPGQVIERKVRFDPLPQGCYRAELRIMGKPTVLSDIVFSIMPQPRRVPYMQSNWGVDTAGGTHFNTYDWDVSAFMRRLGFHWARVWSWQVLEDVGFSYELHNLSPEEGLRAANLWMNNLKKHGIGILASVHPRFKYATQGLTPWPPKTKAEYADYEANLREIMSRFGDRIDYWEVGNEPYSGSTTPENYARWVRATVRTLRETKPGAKVISMAGAANGEKEWIEQSFKAGALDGVDGFSFHYGTFGSDTRGEMLDRYRLQRHWALRAKARPLEVWDSEEAVRGPSFYPVRVVSATGLQDLNHRPAYPGIFCRDFKVYLCNSAMNIRTIGFNAEYSMTASGYERGFFERDGAVRPSVVASFLAAQLIQTMEGGGFYRTPNKLFGALFHDDQQSVLAVWSEEYSGTVQVHYSDRWHNVADIYVNPFNLVDRTPRSAEELEEILDFYRDVHPVKVKVPDGVKVLDTMAASVEPDEDGKITVDIYPKYLVVPRDRERGLLQALGAELKLPPMPRWKGSE